MRMLMIPEQERQIEGAGTPDADWQAWPGLAALPPVTARELVPGSARAVVVAPHPDDEILACGGLLQLLAQQGSEVLLVAVTDGGASHPGSSLWPKERLSRVRPDESVQAATALGITPAWLRLHLPDGGVTAREAHLGAMLREILRPGDTVLTTWRFDGHPDHEACGRACAAAAPACGALLVEMPVWTWHWAAPGDARVPWQRARRLLLPGDLLRRKREAVRCFASQIEADASTGQPAILAHHALQRLLHPYEVYFR